MKDIVKLISSLSQLLREWMKSANVRRTRAFKKAAWDYVNTIERKDIKESTRKKYKVHFKKRMRAYN